MTYVYIMFSILANQVWAPTSSVGTPGSWREMQTLRPSQLLCQNQHFNKLLGSRVHGRVWEVQLKV